MRADKWACLAGISMLAVAGCGQHHTPQAEDDDERRPDHQTVVVSKQAIERGGIRVAAVENKRLVGGVSVPAEVQLDPDRTAHIASMVSGQIDEAKATLGDRVSKGQVLATLRSVSLGEARAALARAKAAAEVARANFERQQELQREAIGSERNFLESQGELRQTEAELASAAERLRVYGGRGGSGSSTTIRSPIDGVVIERHATPGEVVSPEQRIFVVADTSRVWVVGKVYEQDVAVAQVGAPAIVALQAYPDRTWDGEVSYVASTLDPHTRTLSIRVELDNPEGVLRPGLFGTLQLSPGGDGKGAVPVVPERAVQRVEGNDVVFVPGTSEGQFRAVPVTLGTRARGSVQVREGIRAGARVVVAGAFILKSELLSDQIEEDEDE